MLTSRDIVRANIVDALEQGGGFIDDDVHRDVEELVDRVFDDSRSEESDPDRVVPPEVGTAIATRRVEFLTALRMRVKAGEVLPVVELLGIIDLVQEHVVHADWLDVRRNGAVSGIKELQHTFLGISSQFDKLAATLLDDLNA